MICSEEPATAFFLTLTLEKFFWRGCIDATAMYRSRCIAADGAEAVQEEYRVHPTSDWQ